MAYNKNRHLWLDHPIILLQESESGKKRQGYHRIVGFRCLGPGYRRTNQGASSPNGLGKGTGEVETKIFRWDRGSEVGEGHHNPW